VDGRGYESCQEAMKAASTSPFKSFIRYVIGCNCGDPHMLPDSRELKATIPECTGNAIDDFFGAEQPVQTSMVAHCRSTMLPLMGQDLDDDMVSQTMTDMMNVTGLPEDEVDKMWHDKHNDKYSSNLEMIQVAFRTVTRLAEAEAEKPYSEPVDASEFHLARADNEIEFAASAMGDLEVDPVDPGLQQTVEPVASTKTNFDGVGALASDVGEVLLAGTPDLSPIDIELTDESNPSRLAVAEPKEALAPIMVNEKPAEMEVNETSQAPIDVEMTQFQEEEFEDTDIVDLNERCVPPGELDIEMGGEIEI
jgi:hypothetical protein